MVSTLSTEIHEEITTIFVVGFPDDITEREFQNIFTFSKGFEAAILKIPSSLADQDEQFGYGRKQIIGFAKFRSRQDALDAKNILTGKKIDIDRHCILKAEFAKKNLHSKRLDIKATSLHQQINPLHFIVHENISKLHHDPFILNSTRRSVTPSLLSLHPVLPPNDLLSKDDSSLYIHSPPPIPNDILNPNDFPGLELQDHFLQQQQQSQLHPPHHSASSSSSSRQLSTNAHYHESSIHFQNSSIPHNGFNEMYMDLLNPSDYTPSTSVAHSRAASLNGNNNPFSIDNSNLDLNGTALANHFSDKGILSNHFSSDLGMHSSNNLSSHFSMNSPQLGNPSSALATHFPPPESVNIGSSNLSQRFTSESGSLSHHFPSDQAFNNGNNHPHHVISDQHQSNHPLSQIYSTDSPKHFSSDASLNPYQNEPVASPENENEASISSQMQNMTLPDWPPFRSIDQNPPCNTLYVGNLPPNTTPEELESLFSKTKGYRRLCFRNRPSGPMCFVEFEDINHATQVMYELYGYPLTTHQKGGIRLSYSKNPLGVRLVPNQQKEDEKHFLHQTHPLLLI